MSLEDLLEFYCKKRDCTPKQIKSTSRKVPIALYRHAFIALAISQKFERIEIAEFLERNRSGLHHNLGVHLSFAKSNRRYKKLIGIRGEL